MSRISRIWTIKPLRREIKASISPYLPSGAARIGSRCCAIPHLCMVEATAIVRNPNVIAGQFAYRRLEPNAQLMEFQCREMAEETVLGRLRRNQLVKQWVGRTMRVEITRKLPPGNGLERHFSGNPTSKEWKRPPRHRLRSCWEPDSAWCLVASLRT